MGGAVSERALDDKGQFRRWLMFGLGIKRWIFLCVFLGVLAGILFYDGINSSPSAGGEGRRMIVVSLAMVMLFICVYSSFRIIRFVDNIAQLAKKGELEDYFIDIKPHSYVPKIVMLGGGTGLSTLLRGIREYGNLDSSKNISAIVTVADDGGSSGRLREEMNILPPGDIRNCLIALSTEEPLLTKLFQYRFREGTTGLSGHSFGNLFIAAMSDVSGDFVKAVKESSKILAVSGKVLPSTVTPLNLKAIFDDGTFVNGESQITCRNKKISRIEIVPENAEALPEAISEIESADAIIIGPGSLYTSLIPNLLIKGLRDAINGSNALKVYICNVMTQHGETDGYSASAHLEAITGALGGGNMDYIIVSDIQNADPGILERYSSQNAFPVEIDIEKIAAMGTRIVRADLSAYKDFLRHDPRKLARCVMGLIKDGNVRKKTI